MDKYGFKRITDAVHGTIGLSELEVEILSSQVFQRLRRINQLGLAHLVFPGANYSRLSHFNRRVSCDRGHFGVA